MKSPSKYDAWKSVRKQKAPAERTHRPKTQYVRRPKYKNGFDFVVDSINLNDWNDDE